MKLSLLNEDDDSIYDELDDTNEFKAEGQEAWTIYLDDNSIATLEVRYDPDTQASRYFINNKGATNEIDVRQLYYDKKFSAKQQILNSLNFEDLQEKATEYLETHQHSISPTHTQFWMKVINARSVKEYFEGLSQSEQIRAIHIWLDE